MHTRVAPLDEEETLAEFQLHAPLDQTVAQDMMQRQTEAHQRREAHRLVKLQAKKQAAQVDTPESNTPTAEEKNDAAPPSLPKYRTYEFTSEHPNKNNPKREFEKWEKLPLQLQGTILTKLQDAKVLANIAATSRSMRTISSKITLEQYHPHRYVIATATFTTVDFAKEVRDAKNAEAKRVEYTDVHDRVLSTGVTLSRQRDIFNLVKAGNLTDLLKMTPPVTIWETRNIRTCDQVFMTPRHYAVLYHYRHILDYFDTVAFSDDRERKKDSPRETPSWRQSLESAVSNDLKEETAELLSKRKKLQPNHHTLNIAIKRGNTAMIKLLLEAKAPAIDESDLADHSLALAVPSFPIFVAAYFPTPPVVITLLADAKADVNLFSYYGATPLMTAAARGNVGAIRGLLDNKAEINERRTLLQAESVVRKHALIHEKQEDRREIESTLDYKETALCTAARHQQTQAVAMLLEAKADVLVADVSNIDAHYHDETLTRTAYDAAQNHPTRKLLLLAEIDKALEQKFAEQKSIQGLFEESPLTENDKNLLKILKEAVALENKSVIEETAKKLQQLKFAGRACDVSIRAQHFAEGIEAPKVTMAPK